MPPAMRWQGWRMRAIWRIRSSCKKLVYYDIRQQFSLSSQMAIRAISKVAEAYKREKSIKPSFRPHGAMVYDERICSFPSIDRVSLLTLDGRVEVPFRFGAYAKGMLQRTRGQADLLYRSETFYLAVTVDAPEPTPGEVGEYIGVDLGIITLATTSDGEFLNHSAGPKHAHVNQVRARFSRFRQKLQKKGTKSAKRLARERGSREKRFCRDINHCLSKAIVQTAKGTSRGIALEDLQGIRERAGKTVRKRHRRVLHSWAFFQLRAFIAYKAALAGVPVCRCAGGRCAGGLHQPGLYQPDVQPLRTLREGQSPIAIEVPLQVVRVLRPCRSERGPQQCGPGGCHTARRGAPRGVAASRRALARADYDIRSIAPPSPRATLKRNASRSIDHFAAL